MRNYRQIVALVVVFSLLFSNVAAFAAGSNSISSSVSESKELSLKLIGRYYSSGQEGVNKSSGSEIVAYDFTTKKAFMTNGADSAIDILDLSTLQSGEYTVVGLANRVKVEELGLGVSDITSVAVNKDKDLVAVAVPAKEKTDNGMVVFLNKEGSVINSVYVGALPDMVTFTPDGKKLLVANEGEPSDDYSIDPEGSVSIIDVSNGVSSVAENVYFNNNVNYANTVRIFGPNATPAQDFEPEFISVEPNSKTAYVSLQENNSVAVLDIENKKFENVHGLGYKDHSVEGNGLDASDKDGNINIKPWPVLGMYQPDGIAVLNANGKNYILSANEGDAREWGDFVEEEKVGDLGNIALDADKYSGYTQEELDQLVANGLVDKNQLGRLIVSKEDGKNDAGTYEALYSFGARSFSVWDPTDGFKQVYDSGDDFEQITGKALESYFNASNDNVAKDNRSDNKGPEPEYVKVGEVGDEQYAFIGLERIGGIMVYNVTNPEQPKFVTYYNSRDFSADVAGDVAPEGLEFIPADKSPTGTPLVLAANEVSGTVAVFEITKEEQQEITKPKNIVLLIGDGMGFEQVEAARDEKAESGLGSLYMDSINDASGTVTTHSADAEITDSSSAATAIASGYKINNNVLGLLPDGTPVPTVLELGEVKGLATGVITTTQIAHATPAGFASHIKHRNMYNTIAVQMIDTDMEVVMGGAKCYFQNRQTLNSGKSYEDPGDDRDLIAEAVADGYDYVSDIDGLNGLGETTDKVLGIFHDDNGLVQERSTNPTFPETQPHLNQMTAKGLEVLAKDQDGFFLMVEGGQIDWACHANDLNNTIGETLAFDEAVKAAMDFKAQHPDTLIIITADHECGGLGYDPVTNNATWSSKDHTATPVGIWAEGPGAELFNGDLDNTDIARKVAQLLDLPKQLVVQWDETNNEFKVTSMGTLVSGAEIKLNNQSVGTTDESGKLVYNGNGGTFELTAYKENYLDAQARNIEIKGTTAENVSVQLLGMNDFHGQLDTYKTINDETVVGGAEYVAAYLKQRDNNNTLIVHSGDMVGASSPVSALLQDEPTIDFMNRVGFDVGTFGNHEFDQGLDEAKRLVNGGPNPKTGQEFAGANFDYVSANVVYNSNNQPVFDPYVIKEVGGVKIGITGITTLETPNIVTPSGISEIKFIDPVSAVNDVVAQLKSQGIETIVVLAHAGASLSNEVPEGEAIDFANAVDDEVDVIFAGHNHVIFNQEVNGKLVVEGNYYGRDFVDVDLEINPNTGDVVSKTAEIVDTVHNITPDAEIKQMLDDYLGISAPILNAVVGRTEGVISKTQNEAGESALGNLIADAQRYVMQSEFAFMNPGGIRDDLPAGEITWGQVFKIQPFNNNLIKMSLTGAQIRQILNTQWQVNRMLQISGLTYKFDSTLPVEDRILEIKKADGTPVQDNETYTVTVNSFLADGGDGFTVLVDGTDRFVGPVDLDGLITYINAEFTGKDLPISADIEGRIQIADKDTKPFTIGASALDRTSGIKATINVCRTNAEDHDGKEVVIFQLMNGQIPVSIVALQKDILTSEDLIAYFNEAGDDFFVKAFVFDEFNSDIASVQTSLAALKDIY